MEILVSRHKDNNRFFHLCLQEKAKFKFAFFVPHYCILVKFLFIPRAVLCTDADLLNFLNNLP